MKKLFVTLFTCLFGYLSSFAQVIENKLPMCLGVQSGISITIPDAESKVIDKVWKKYTKDYGRITKKRKSDEQILADVIIPAIHGENKMDIYLITENNGLTAFFDLKNGFLNSSDYPKEYASATIFVQEFAYEVQREMVRELLEKEEDLLKKLNRQMSNLLHDNKTYHQDIEEGKAKIKKAENNIVVNEKDQEQTKTLIAEKAKTVEMVQMKLNKIGKPE